MTTYAIYQTDDGAKPNLEPFHTYLDRYRVGWCYAPTLGKFRGVAIRDGWKPDENPMPGHAVCSHEHATEKAAIRCAKRMAKTAERTQERMDT